MAEIKKVLANHSQTFTSAEKKTARTNIGASNVGLGTGATQGSSESVTGTTYSTTDHITVAQKSLVLCNVSASIVNSNQSADLGIDISASPAVKLGIFDGDQAFGNTAAQYRKSGSQTLDSQTGFFVVLNTGETLTINYTFQSSVADFTVTHILNYIVLGVS